MNTLFGEGEESFNDSDNAPVNRISHYEPSYENPDDGAICSALVVVALYKAQQEYADCVDLIHHLSTQLRLAIVQETGIEMNAEETVLGDISELPYELQEGITDTRLYIYDLYEDVKVLQEKLQIMKDAAKSIEGQTWGPSVGLNAASLN